MGPGQSQYITCLFIRLKCISRCRAGVIPFTKQWNPIWDVRSSHKDTSRYLGCPACLKMSRYLLTPTQPAGHPEATAAVVHLVQVQCALTASLCHINTMQLWTLVGCKCYRRLRPSFQRKAWKVSQYVMGSEFLKVIPGGTMCRAMWTKQRFKP